MALIYCGIDEAGYGPTLGPLCVGMSIFRVEDWREGDAAPDLWSLLSSAVCRDGSDKRRRIAIDDSKKLKLANSSVRKHPLHHLERGVLAFLVARQVEGAASVGGAITSDRELLEALGVPIGESGRFAGWYEGLPSPAPQGCPAETIGIAANTLRLALRDAGVGVLGMGVEAVGEAMFNELVEATGTKAAVTESVLTRYFADVWERFGAIGAEGGHGVRVVCDRQGGRTQYGGLLSRTFPDATITTIAETPSQSKYEIRGSGGQERAMSVAFKVEAEASHLPVALASMIAKLTRELMMARFNRYWCNRIPELKPTAGYALDARRWLRDVHGEITARERAGLVRRA